MSKNTCFHCGDDATVDVIEFDDKIFCCQGCKTVYDIFKNNDLTAYYDLEKNPGITPNDFNTSYDFLNNESVANQLLDFKEEGIAIVTLYIPKIHCSSCVWVLEHLQKLNKDILKSRVHFSKKTVQITFKDSLPLKQVVLLLATIGYNPYISLNDGEKHQKKSKKATYKIAIAGFAFGNTMFLSFPDYFGKPDVWLTQYQPLFGLLMFLFSIPVVFYAGNDYLISAFKGLRKKVLNIDVPISIGIIVLFLRSSYEFFTQTGQGYFDSLSGLIFFLLLGKLFQQKTYDFLSFERDFKSYFPIAITVLQNDTEVTVPVNEIKVGDELLIRNEEVIPTDGIITEGAPMLDYSFVTGESHLIKKQVGDKVFAGGKHQGKSIKVKVLKTVDQSYLTKLWSQNSYDSKSTLNNITDTVSKYFTWALLIITLLAAIYWFFVDTSKIINVITSILIVACPCALALSAPFALGNVLRVLGKKGFYLKDSFVIEQLANINSIFFDKTGTLTTTNKQHFSFEGEPLSSLEINKIISLVRNSNHPLSRSLYKKLKGTLVPVQGFKEVEGKGVEGVCEQTKIKIGSAKFVNTQNVNDKETCVYISFDDKIRGRFVFGNQYRTGIFATLNKLAMTHEINILSGDQNSSLTYLKQELPNISHYYFNQTPQDKLDKVKASQQQHKSVMMVGDGLNDAGALLQSQVGVAVAEDINVFSPASDAIIDAAKLKELPAFISYCKKSLQVVKISFVLSILYNIVGLSFAIAGVLTPLIAAVLMPLSSITIVVFVTVATNFLAKKIHKPI